MFTFPALWLGIVSLAQTVAYFVMLSPRINLKLWVFLLISLGMTALVAVTYVLAPSKWIWYGGIQVALYDVGCIVNLLLRKKTVREVVGIK